MTLLEYRATGLPTIASKMGGIPEYCNKNTTLLVEYNESFIEGLAEAIQLLKCDDMLRDRMSEQATLDLEQFGYTSYYKNFVDIIANVSSESKEYLNGNYSGEKGYNMELSWIVFSVLYKFDYPPTYSFKHP